MINLQIMDLWRFIHQQLSGRRRLFLLTVIDHEGSSPGKQGFKMAVSDNGEICGSIGGGPMEYRLVEQARRMLRAGQMESRLIRQHHDPEAGEDWSGLTCMGRQAVVFVPIDEQQETTIRYIIDTLEAQGGGVLTLTPDRFAFSTEATLPESKALSLTPAKEWTYREQLGLLDTLYIFGGGHVGLALSRLFHTLDFRIEVFDNRKKLDLLEQNPYAHHKALVDYREVNPLVPEGPHVYVVIMTFSHRGDMQVLDQLLSKRVRYLGMMGSKNKVNGIFAELRKKGHPDALLRKVKAPVGLVANSSTPAEIAVSVAAEIIQVRNEKSS